ncbi:MAG: preprotein translocase subunit SecG [Alphaproteobacteria bacterium]|nr:preprotein translocase subunit SecG [Alphaproteobacteria bacterium]
MAATLLVIHILLAIALIAVILVQRTTADGGGLMGGGGGSNMGGLMSVRGTANLLTRVTGIIATAFIATSILLTILAGSHTRTRSITDEIKPAAIDQKAPETTTGKTDKPAQSAPAVPVSK